MAFPGPVALLVFALLVGAAAWALCGRQARSAADAAVGVAAWSGALVIAYVTGLSSARALTAWSLLALSAAGAVGAWAWRRCAAIEPTAPEPAHEDAWWIVCTAPAALLAIGMALAIWSGPETGNDNLAYHLPRLGYWLQQRAAAPFVAGNARAGSFPPDGNVLQLPPVIFLGHDRFCGGVQLAAALLTAVAIHGIARGLGASGFGASLAALCWLAIPCLLEQAARSLVDATASFFVAAAAFFLARDAKGAHGPLAALVCVAIAAGTKTPTLLLGLPLAAVALWRLGRVHRRVLGRAALASPLALWALGGAYHVQCARVWSGALGPASIRWVVVFPSLTTLGKNAELVVYPLLSLARPATEASFGRAAWAAATGYGLGAGWLVVWIFTGLLLVASLARHRRAPREWAALWALGSGALLALCFALRHQDAVLRFLLPAAALVTPSFAWAFDQVARAPSRRLVLAALGMMGATLMAWRWVGNERATRHRDGRPLSRSERFGADLQPLALAADAPDLPPGARWGLLVPDYFPEGVFFGRGYRNRLVPLSYRPPRTLEEIEALGLDALWVDTREACTVVLFRREFTPPPARPQVNRRAQPDSYDVDFAQAYTDSVSRVDFKPAVRALAAPGSPWGVWLTTPRGVLFVKGRGRRVDAREVCGTP